MNSQSPASSSAEQSQATTYTKWLNMILSTTTISDLFTDLRDGQILCRLANVLTHSTLRPTSGRSDIHRGENINSALSAFSKDIALVNIGSDDLLVGNRRITLGLIWRLILKYQINSGESKDIKAAKEDLLAWIREKLKQGPYSHLQPPTDFVEVIKIIIFFFPHHFH